MMSRFLRSHQFQNGEMVSQFEKRFGRYIDADDIMTFSSGKEALTAALLALQDKKGEEVILPTYVCVEVLEAVLDASLKPVFADVDFQGVLDIDTVQRVLTTKTKAIIAVHIFGNPCDISSLRELQIPIIEDCCHSLGSHGPRKGGQTLNPKADFSFFSLGPTKPLTAGQGGVLVQNRPERERGLYNSIPSAFSKRFSEFNATLGLSQLRNFDRSLEKKQKLRKLYDSAFGILARTGNSVEVEVPFRYCIRSQIGFEIAQDMFEEHGVAVRRGVDNLLHRLVGLGDSKFPVASEIFQTNISLPFHASLTTREIRQVARAIVVLRDELL